MYCAASVYIYQAQNNLELGLSGPDVTNLEFILNAMEALGRNHAMTKSFLQHLYLDVELNGLSTTIAIPDLSDAHLLFGRTPAKIPLLARSSVNKHTAVQPPIPELPLGSPKGNLRTPSSHGLQPGVYGTGQDAELLHDDSMGSKRKRMSPDPSVIGPTGVGYPTPMYGSVFANTPPVRAQPAQMPSSGASYPASYPTGFIGVPAEAAIHNAPQISLPHRSSSASSSPMNHGPPALSVSSGSTPPGVAGRGALGEEPPMDLSQFHTQPGIANWDTPSGCMYAQVTDPIVPINYDANNPTNNPWGMPGAVDNPHWDAQNGGQRYQ
jgi:hypothetical protein